MKRSSTTLKNDEIDSVAIGGFDGIHLAHQKLISHLTSSGALVVIDKKSASLTPNSYRCKHTAYDCLFLRFEEIRDLQADEFIRYLTTHFKNLKKIVVGYDFRFGKDAHANVEELKKIFDGEVVVVDEVFYDGISVHSRVIRSLLKDAQIQKANRLLGRDYEIVGEVIKGQGIGAKKLFPTINLKTEGFLIPKEGVYATLSKIDEDIYPSATFIGKRVSTDGEFSIETHILSKDIEYTDNEITIYFIDFIRDNLRFKNLELLKKQIEVDLVEIKERLSLFT
jgi:riboflavin kinase/FMN adenylyltransferase